MSVSTRWKAVQSLYRIAASQQHHHHTGAVSLHHHCIAVSPQQHHHTGGVFLQHHQKTCLSLQHHKRQLQQQQHHLACSNYLHKDPSRTSNSSIDTFPPCSRLTYSYFPLSYFSTHTATLSNIVFSNGNYYQYYYKKYFERLCSAMLFFTGMLLGGTLKLASGLGNDIDELDRSVSVDNMLMLLPKVSAAKSYSESDEDSLNNNNNKKKGPPNHRHTMNFIADVVEQLAPSVVYIETLHPVRRDNNGRPLRVNSGSGFVVEQDGLILTNAHVVTNGPRNSKIMVRFHDGVEKEGYVEVVDSLSDLAAVRVNASNLPAARLGASSELRAGEFVVAVGSPLSLSNSVSSGVVSSTNRCATDLGIRPNDITYIQTDAAITHGNSGGPLANLDGEVIAINSMKAAEGISFAIPVDTAKKFLDRTKQYRASSPSSPSPTRRRRYIGITMLSLNPEIINELQGRTPLPPDLQAGVMVWKVAVGSPAYHAGLAPGDVISNINGHTIASAADVYKILERTAQLTMVVHRKNDRYTVTVTPEE